MVTDKERLIAARLQQRRKELGIKQEVASKALRQYSSYISKVENGDKELRLEEFVKLCEYYDLDAAEVIKLLF